METGTVTLKIKEYNQLIAFKKEVLKGNKIVVKNPNGLYRQGTIRYYTDEKIAKEIASESENRITRLSKRIEDLDDIIVVLKDVASKAEYIKSMNYWELFKWRLKH